MSVFSKRLAWGSALAVVASGLLLVPSAPAQAVTGVFISEFHYDDTTANDGGGVGEFVEITAAAGTDLTGWKLQLVNGNGNAVYRTDTLSGSVVDQVDGWGTLVFTYPTASGGVVQNGSPDGIALLDAGGAVVEFVSYEGPMTASLGTPAVSVTSLDTGAAQESNSTPGDQTIHRLADGGWTGPSTNTKGAPNGYTAGEDPEPTPLGVTAPADKTVEVGLPITPIALAATGGSGTYTWDASGLPAGLSVSGGQIVGTPTEVGGPTTVTLTVDDGETTDQATFAITVTAAPDLTPIAEIQGDGDRSPYAGEGTGQGTDTLTTTGVVTGMYKDASFANNGFDGFTIQTAGTGTGSDTSEGSNGLFVYYGSNAIPAGIAVGDSVRVTGKVSEYFGLTEFNIGSTGVVELSTPLDPVTPRVTAYPTTDAEREALESTLIAPTDTFTVTNAYSTNQYGEIGLATGDTPLQQPSEFADATDDAALQVIRDRNAERAVTLDDGTGVNYLANQTTKAQPVPYLTAADGTANPAPPRVGAEASLHTPVVLDYRNDTWKFQPTAPVYLNGADVATFEDTRASNLHPQEVGGDLTISTFNVLNYFNTTGEAYSLAGPQQSPRRTRSAPTTRTAVRARRRGSATTPAASGSSTTRTRPPTSPTRTTDAGRVVLRPLRASPVRRPSSPTPSRRSTRTSSRWRRSRTRSSCRGRPTVTTRWPTWSRSSTPRPARPSGPT